MYKMHVSSLKNKFAIRILRPATREKFRVNVSTLLSIGLTGLTGNVVYLREIEVNYSEFMLHYLQNEKEET